MEFLSVPLKTGSYFAVLHIHIIYEHSQTRTTISLSSENAYIARARCLRLKSRAGQIGHNLANSLQSLQHFCKRSCVALAQ